MTYGLLAAVVVLAVGWGVLFRAVVRTLSRRQSADDEATNLRITHELQRVDGLEKALGDEVPDAMLDLEGTLRGLLDRMAARLDDLEARRPRVEMDDLQRQELKAHWPEVACRECGYAHPGVCPRVKSQRVETVTDPQGRMLGTTTTVEYWPNSEWEPPAGAVTSEDVWSTPVPIPPTEEPAK